MKRRSARLAAKRKRDAEIEKDQDNTNACKDDIREPAKKKMKRNDSHSSSPFPTEWNSSDDESEIEMPPDSSPLLDKKHKKTKSECSKKKNRIKKRKKSETTQKIKNTDQNADSDVSVEIMRKSKRKTKKNSKRKKKPKGEYNKEQIQIVFNTLDTECNGILSLANVLNGFHSVNQQDSIDAGLAKKMLMYADKQGDNDHTVMFNDFLCMCRLANLCYE